MGYLYLCIAILAGTAKGFCGKKVSGKISEAKDAMAANIIRMLLCVFVGFGIVCARGEFALIKIESNVLWISLLCGISTSAFVVLWMILVKSSAYMMVEVFLMTGTIIPITGGALFFAEPIETNQWIGLVILIFAVFVMCLYNNSVKIKMEFSSFILLVFCGASNGLADFSQKLFVRSESVASSAVFNFYTYVFSSLFLFLSCTMLMRIHKESGTEKIFEKVKGSLMYIVVMSICLFFYSYFKVLAAEHLPAAQLYPLVQGSGMIASTLMSAFLFGEKLTAKGIIGILLAFVGLVFINVL